VSDETRSTIPTLRWLKAAETRRSRRKYLPDPISGPAALALDDFCRDFAPFEGARTVLVREAPARFFTSIVLGYGKVSSPSALVFVGDRRRPEAAAAAGFTAEAAVLEATAMGFATCWIGGGVRRNDVEALLGLAPHDHVYSISALGYASDRPTLGERTTAGMVRARSRKSLDVLAPGHAEWPDWARAGLEAARLAPSATNRQPWRFAMGDDSTARTDRTVRLFFNGPDTPVISKRLDCGIAMLHFELGARAAGVGGSWTFLGGNDVARWTPRSDG
jgi:hypothetical protein